MGIQDWAEMQDRVFSLYGDGKISEALTEANRAAEVFPDRVTRTSYWRACLHSLLGEKEKAIGVLRAALDGGAWWSDVTLKGETDLAPLRDMPEFQSILRACAGRHQAEAGTGRLEIVRIDPRTASGGAPPPLLLALHSRGATAESFARMWEPAADLGIAVAVPQSSQMCASDQYCWDDEDKAGADMRLAYERVKAETGFDPNRIVLAGASQGGRLAVLSSLRGDPVPSKGFIAVVPAIRDVAEFATHLKAASERGVKGYMVAGDKDRFYKASCDLQEAMEAEGLRCALEVRPGMGHRFPLDFGDTLSRALELVLA